jgi:hypothetical protein
LAETPTTAQALTQSSMTETLQSLRLPDKGFGIMAK